MYFRCAKEFQVKGSTKIKKKKKNEKNNNQSAVNKAFEGDDDEKHPNTHASASGTSTNVTGGGNETLEKEKTHSRNFIAENRSNITRTKKCKKGSDEKQGHLCVIETREEESIRRNSSCFSEDQKRNRKVSLVSSMIHDLQREDTFIKETVTSVTPSYEGSGSRAEGPRLNRQITSTSVSVSVVTSKAVQNENIPNREDRVKRMGAETMKQNCKMLLTGIGDTGNGLQQNAKPKRTDPVILNYYKDQNQCFSNNLKTVKGDSVGKQGVDTTQRPKRSQLIDSESDKVTTCCFQWQPSLSNNKVKKSSKDEEDSEQIDTEKNDIEVRNSEKTDEKVSFLHRMKTKITRRKVMAAMCPCFTYFILEGETKEKPLDKEKEKSDKNQQEIR